MVSNHDHEARTDPLTRSRGRHLEVPDMDRDPDTHPVFVTLPDGDGEPVAKVARPGVVVWLAERVPDEDEVAQAREAAMRRHPANSRSRHLRAVS